MELHVFDFDGTIFHSPAPSARLRGLQDGHLHSKLMRPLQDGGLGWFQSLASLSPPVVPEAPALDAWYVQPILQRLRGLEERLLHNAAMGEADEAIKVYVLTGRDEKYRQRIEEILHHAGLREVVTGVLLKPHETYGTVKYKLESLYHLIAQHHPEHVFYYEDREEQGGKILGGIRLLSQAVNTKADDNASVITAVLEASGEVRLLTPRHNNDHHSKKNSTTGDVCSAAMRWWEETKRRVSPAPLTSISPFNFTMMLVDPELAARSETVLQPKEEDALVAQLKYEKEAYDAGRGAPSGKRRGSTGEGLHRHRNRGR